MVLHHMAKMLQHVSNVSLPKKNMQLLMMFEGLYGKKITMFFPQNSKHLKTNPKNPIPFAPATPEAVPTPCRAGRCRAQSRRWGAGPGESPFCAQRAGEPQEKCRGVFWSEKDWGGRVSKNKKRNKGDVFLLGQIKVVMIVSVNWGRKMLLFNRFNLAIFCEVEGRNVED